MKREHHELPQFRRIDEKNGKKHLVRLMFVLTCLDSLEWILSTFHAGNGFFLVLWASQIVSKFQIHVSLLQKYANMLETLKFPHPEKKSRHFSNIARRSSTAVPCFFCGETAELLLFSKGHLGGFGTTQWPKSYCWTIKIDGTYASVRLRHAQARANNCLKQPPQNTVFRNHLENPLKLTDSYSHFKRLAGGSGGRKLFQIRP